MLGMTFLSFVVLSIIGGLVAAAYHWVFRYRVLEGTDSAFGKLVVGYVGAWLGSPVLGHWMWKVEDVYIVPAILGAIATVHLNVLAAKMLMKATAPHAMPTETERPKAATAM